MYRDFAKRIFDMILAYIGILIFSPVFLLLMIFIFLEEGWPIFFFKDCIGLEGKEFRQIKFRSMIKEAEKITGPVWAKKNDSRVTVIGRFLRKTALDELPQLINILKGEMSFVGPRPQRKVLVERYLRDIPNYHLRFKVKPGLTGPAQVFLAYDASVEKKIKFDLWYVEKYNLLWDIELLARSFVITLTAAWGKFEGEMDNALMAGS
ncbi:MAG: sugar transferase [Candidatus Omnitrophica bacterium]|nr:sugar transferase [Candidatus Omnitrophota bacterium]